MGLRTSQVLFWNFSRESRGHFRNVPRDPRGHFRNVPWDPRGDFRNVPPPWRSSGPLPGRSAGRPAKGKKPKGRNGSDPKLNCATRRVRFFFGVSLKKRVFTGEVSKKKIKALSPESGAIFGAKGPQTRGRAHSGFPSDFFVRAVRGVISGMCPGTRAEGWGN